MSKVSNPLGKIIRQVCFWHSASCTKIWVRRKLNTWMNVGSSAHASMADSGGMHHLWIHEYIHEFGQLPLENYQSVEYNVWSLCCSGRKFSIRIIFGTWQRRRTCQKFLHDGILTIMVNKATKFLFCIFLPILVCCKTFLSWNCI